MTELKDNFHRLQGFENLYVVQFKKLWCVFLRLSDNSLCIYSPPSGLKGEDIKEIQKLGDVSVLCAPNHYHHRGLAEHVNLFPNAKLVCSTYAKPRLENQTGFQFENLNQLTKKLPETVTVLEPEGLKTGEIWLEIKDKDSTLWIVCDAFSSSPSKMDIFYGEPSMLKTFPNYGVGDRAVYKTWVVKQLSNHPPDVIVPCHGPPARQENLAQTLKNIVEISF